MKKIIIVIIILLIIIGVNSKFFIKANPISSKNKDFIGNWTSENGRILNIYKDGYLEYKKEFDFRYFSFDYGMRYIIKNISEKNISTKTLFFINSNFKINKKPYIDGKFIKVIINGEKFKRKNYNGEIPKKEDLQKLILNTLSDFNLGLDEKNFEYLYENSSKNIKKEFSLENFNKNLKKFFEFNLDINEELNNDFIFTEKTYIDKNKLLNIKGYIFSKKRKIYFSLQYIYEYPEWKLFSIYLDKIRILIEN